ncbi:biopolymer transporter ExbD [uncultured Lentibacter sp.]|jgi:biopolymer transport protein ExbD|uniref:ExbD/TolR family protein n=1 Tax=uncultured Lentibacter sp. TaxID=1659309 RepID=UPI00260A5807|nr:biopolymer transporter ExbD [uncultured Lentibacter sp.]
MSQLPRRSKLSSRREPTIALINIVFLMLIFFMVAGTLAPPLAQDLELVDTTTLEGTQPPDALVLSADGGLHFRGESLSASEFMARLPQDERQRVRLVPDRAAPAQTLVQIAAELKGAGAGSVVIVTERALN